MPKRPTVTVSHELSRPDVWLFRSTRSPLARIRIGAKVLCCVVLVAIVGFRILGNYDWLEAAWMTTITISSVGFAERTDSSWELQLFTMFVIVFGLSAVMYTLGGFFQMVLEGELETVMGHRRMTRGIEELNDHVIICGFGRMGEVLAQDLRHNASVFVVIDNSPERFEAARADGCLCLYGDATEDETLMRAGVERARCLVSCLPSDADNVFITLTARNLMPDLQIIARAEHSNTKTKLLQAGASKVVMPAIVGAHRMERLINRPSTADLMELVTEATFRDLELDEIFVPENCKLIGKTVAATEAHRRHKLLVVAVKHAGGEMIFNPHADYAFAAADVAIVMGHIGDIDRFRSEFGLASVAQRADSTKS